MTKRMNFYCLLISVAVGSVVLIQGYDVPTNCPTGLSYTSAMKLHNNICYQFVSLEKFWHQARDHCLLNSGRLVKIDDSDTNQFIVNSLNDLWWRNNGVWIGLHDISSEMNWEWTGYELYQNEPVHWTNWARGHPGAFLHSRRDCVRMVRGQWKWHETFCHLLRWKYRFICEYRVNSSRHIASSASGVVLHHPPLHGQSNPANIMVESFQEETERLNIDETQAEASVQLENDEKTNTYGKEVLTAIGCILVGTLAIIILFTFFIRRRRLWRKQQDSPEICTSLKDKDPYDGMVETGCRRPGAVANIYVDSNVAGRVTTRLASKPVQEVAEDFESYDDGDSYEEEQELEASAKSSKEKLKDNGEEDGAGIDYDPPKAANIYSEIPDNQDDEQYLESSHIYEALAEVKK